MTVVAFPFDRAVLRSNEPIAYDRDMRLMRLYACSFMHLGKQWALKIWAYDDADAEARINAISSSLVVDGQIVAQGDGEFEL